MKTEYYFNNTDEKVTVLRVYTSGKAVVKTYDGIKKTVNIGDLKKVY